MSPRTGRPPLGDQKKSERLEVRITKEKAQQLRECAERMGVSKAMVIEKGIDMVDEATKK